MLSVNIYGSLVHYKEPPLETLIDGWDKPKEEQYFRRQELPPIFNKVEIDKDGNVFLTANQESFALREVDRCRNGYYFWNNGELIYITGKHYFYITYWFLEDGTRPDYRDTDRRYFLFLSYWEKILYCLGVIRGKKRREGASSQACSNLVYEAIFFRNSNCGLVSKTRDDSRDTFTDMVALGYRQLPVFLKPRQLNKEDSVTELVFAHKSISIKDGVVSGMEEDRGHRSKINYRAPVLNAYDRGRMSRLLLDEFGKLEKDVPASILFTIISKTLVQGVKRVGFVEMPSTVNKLTKGGSEFKLLWDNADQTQNPNAPTLNKLVRYFTPAFDGLEGFIGKYGESIIGEPTHEEYQYLVDKWVKYDEFTGNRISEIGEEDIKLGAYNYLLKRRDGLTGDLLEEEIRMFPFDEIELFMAANAGCIFNAFNLNKRIQFLKTKPVFKRKISFYRGLDQIVKWRDITKQDQNFYWEITQFPPDGHENKFDYEDKQKCPSRTIDGVIGVDGYSNSQGGKKYGSKASAWIFKKFDILDEANTNKFIGHLYGRPKEKSDLHNQVLLASEYYGYKTWYEFTSDDYYSYYKERGRLKYLGKFPNNTLDPEKLKEAKKVDRFYGFPINDFAMTKQHDVTIAYIENYCDQIDWIELCEDMIPYDPSKRTPSDRTVSAMITLVCSLELQLKPKRKTPLISVYPNENYQNTKLSDGKIIKTSNN